MHDHPHRRAQQCCPPDCRCRWDQPLYKQPPSVIIRRAKALAQLPPTTRSYRRLMTYTDAVLFSRPDYGELMALAGVITREEEGRQ